MESKRRCRAAPHRPDAGIADVISNVLMVGITVALAAGVSYLLIFEVQAEEQVSTSIRMDTTPTSFHMVHNGGEAIYLQESYLIVTFADHTSETRPLNDLSAGDTNGDGQWGFGETLCLTGGDASCDVDYSGKTISFVELVAKPPGDGSDQLITSWTGTVTGQLPG
ncbi:MAG: type IV pilin N-terminal domain-containing protein [Candidatus Thermoplasmatota archaeon]|nr:type IV pilin N-terminal domain-containing protein [Candidatus Thermoplasmatota archaeon]